MIVTASRRCRSFAIRAVNRAKRREKALRSQFALLNVWGNLGRFRFELSFRLRLQYRSGPSAPVFWFKAKESEKPRHLFVICWLGFFRSLFQARKMVSATIPG